MKLTVGLLTLALTLALALVGPSAALPLPDLDPATGLSKRGGCCSRPKFSPVRQRPATAVTAGTSGHSSPWPTVGSPRAGPAPAPAPASSSPSWRLVGSPRTRTPSPRRPVRPFFAATPMERPASPGHSEASYTGGGGGPVSPGLYRSGSASSAGSYAPAGGGGAAAGSSPGSPVKAEVEGYGPDYVRPKYLRPGSSESVNWGG